MKKTTNSISPWAKQIHGCISTLLYTLITIPLLFSFSALAAKQTFDVSYLLHPAVEPLKALITDVYAELDINVNYIGKPQLMGIKETNNGMHDADIIRFSYVVDNFSNLIKIEPSIVKVHTTLLCRKNVQCDASILTDSYQAVGVHNANPYVTKNLQVQARIIPIESAVKIQEVFRSSNLDYAIYTLYPSLIEALKKDLNFVVLETNHGYHVINSKHRKLKPEIERVFAEKLPQYKDLLNE